MFVCLSNFYRPSWWIIIYSFRVKRKIQMINGLVFHTPSIWKQVSHNSLEVPFISQAEGWQNQDYPLMCTVEGNNVTVLIKDSKYHSLFKMNIFISLIGWFLFSVLFSVHMSSHICWWNAFFTGTASVASHVVDGNSVIHRRGSQYCDIDSNTWYVLLTYLQ